MYVGIGDLIRAARIQGVIDTLQLGTSPPYIQLYSGSYPGTPGAAPPGGAVLLATVNLADPLGTLDSNYILTLTVPLEGMVLVNGTIAWARWRNGLDQFAFDCDVTGVGGGGALIATSLDVYVGGTAKIIAGTLR